jgi:hypothetical protein
MEDSGDDQQVANNFSPIVILPGQRVAQGTAKIPTPSTARSNTINIPSSSTAVMETKTHKEKSNYIVEKDISSQENSVCDDAFLLAADVASSDENAEGSFNHNSFSVSTETGPLMTSSKILNVSEMLRTTESQSVEDYGYETLCDSVVKSDEICDRTIAGVSRFALKAEAEDNCTDVAQMSPARPECCATDNCGAFFAGDKLHCGEADMKFEAVHDARLLSDPLMFDLDID